MNCFFLSTILILLVTAVSPIIYADDDDVTNISTTTQLVLKSTSPKDVVLSSSYPTKELHALYEQWKDQFKREYDTLKEEAMRKLIWLENHAHIEKHNDQIMPAPSYTLGHNDFSDLTLDEFKKQFYLGEYSPGIFQGKGRLSNSGPNNLLSQRTLRGSSDNDSAHQESASYGDEDEDDDSNTPVEDVPETKNWVEEGAVTSVKNQWFCGACWAFSAVGSIEGARYIATGNLTELSVQQLIDCDPTDLGCGGGLMTQAFLYDEDDNGLCSSEDYPYAGNFHWFSSCSDYLGKCTPVPQSKVLKYLNVTETEDDLKAAIATQPVSVAVSAGSFEWQFYRSGVYDKGCNDEMDHGVLAVGYGHYDPTLDPYAKTNATAEDYFLIKNSWGRWWGEEGFIKLGRGVGNEAEGGSSCVLKMASRPIINKHD
ncbi:hypothetical protein ACHAWC_005055 [Mediolabrus comicus]